MVFKNFLSKYTEYLDSENGLEKLSNIINEHEAALKSMEILDELESVVNDINRNMNELGRNMDILWDIADEEIKKNSNEGIDAADKLNEIIENGQQKLSKEEKEKMIKQGYIFKVA
jgi:hypothetical protein